MGDSLVYATESCSGGGYGVPCDHQVFSISIKDHGIKPHWSSSADAGGFSSLALSEDGRTLSIVYWLNFDPYEYGEYCYSEYWSMDSNQRLYQSPQHSNCNAGTTGFAARRIAGNLPSFDYFGKKGRRSGVSSLLSAKHASRP
jgi:hypothetical protein